MQCYPMQQENVTTTRFILDLAGAQGVGWQKVRNRMMHLDVCSVFLNPFARFLTAIKKFRVMEKKRSPVSAMSSVVSR